MSTPLKARPTVYNGIKMRSRLEAGFAAWLDAEHFEWEYEPCAFATEDGQYLPDFRLREVSVTWVDAPQIVYVEVKPESFDLGVNLLSPTHSLTAEQRAIASAAHILGQSEPGVLFLLARPGHPMHAIARMPEEPHCGPEFDPVQVVLVALPDHRTGLALELPGKRRPWRKDYWKPGVSS